MEHSENPIQLPQLQSCQSPLHSAGQCCRLDTAVWLKGFPSHLCEHRAYLAYRCQAVGGCHPAPFQDATSKQINVRATRSKTKSETKPSWLRKHVLARRHRAPVSKLKTELRRTWGHHLRISSATCPLRNLETESPCARMIGCTKQSKLMTSILVFTFLQTHTAKPKTV